MLAGQHTQLWQPSVTGGVEVAVADPREILTRPAPGPPHTVSYGSHPDHVVDVWPAGGDGAPLVIFVHGGFWRAQYDRGYLRPLCNDLVARGYTMAAIEYRRVGQPGGGWPGSFDDVALAFDTVPSLLAATGVSVGQVLLAGHSAGGHLALWGATRHQLPDGSPWRLAGPPPVAGVLALAPVCDLADAYREDLGEGAAGELLAGAPEVFPERYAAVDPAVLPVPEVPTTLVHGVLDDRVPVEQSRRYAGRGVRLVELADVEHFAVVDPLSKAWSRVLDELDALRQ
jgi:acetyl esterase/lipase